MNQATEWNMREQSQHEQSPTSRNDFIVQSNSSTLNFKQRIPIEDFQ